MWPVSKLPYILYDDFLQCDPPSPREDVHRFAHDFRPAGSPKIKIELEAAKPREWRK